MDNEIKPTKRELALKDSFDLNDYELSFKPAELKFDGYDDLKKQVDTLVSQLDGYVVTQETYKYDKKTRSTLNKLRKAIDDRRKEIVSQADAPINKFKEDIKVLTTELKDVSDQIGDGLKAFDEKTKQAKHDENVAKIEELCKLQGLKLEDIDYNPKWDNKSTTWTSIETELSLQFEQLQKDKKVFEDNVAVVTDKADKLTLGTSNYINRLKNGQSLAEVLKQMDIDHEDIVNVAKMQQATKKAEQAELVKHGDKLIDAKTGEVVDRIYTAVFSIKGTKEDMKRVQSFLKDWGISYNGLDKVAIDGKHYYELRDEN